MNELQEHIQQLITEACRHPVGTPKRQKRLTQIIRLIDSQLWRENVPYYQDALQQTWIYFCQNLCEGVTGNVYDPQKANVVTWLNAYLKRRLQDGYLNIQKQRARHVNPTASDNPNGSPLDPIDSLIAPPDPPPLLKEVRAWAISDPTGQLTRIHITKHPDITCKFLILKRFPPETSWKDLSAELGISIGTLSSFYQRQCMPLLREFGRTQGYL